MGEAAHSARPTCELDVPGIKSKQQAMNPRRKSNRPEGKLSVRLVSKKLIISILMTSVRAEKLIALLKEHQTEKRSK
jgi:hypothetical protein